MSIDTNNSVNNYYTIADAAALILPNADWAVGFWLYLGNNAGTSDQQFIGNNNTTAANFMGVYLRGADSGTNPDKFRFTYDDGNVSAWTMTAGTATPANNNWNLVVAQRRAADGQFQLWWCPANSTATKIGSRAIGSEGASDGGTWYIGRRAPSGTQRMLSGNYLAEIFFLDSSLTQTEIEQLAGGIPINRLKTPIFYLPFRTANATENDVMGSHNATEAGAVLVGPHHPPIIAYPDPAAFYMGGAVGNIIAEYSEGITVTPDPAVFYTSGAVENINAGAPITVSPDPAVFYMGGAVGSIIAEYDVEPTLGVSTLDFSLLSPHKIRSEVLELSTLEVSTTPRHTIRVSDELAHSLEVELLELEMVT